MTTKEKIFQIIFETDTKAGKYFDMFLLCLICLSVLTVILASVSSLQASYGMYFYYLEWVFTCFFTLEYILRIYCIKKPIRYIFSFFGMIDFFAIIPTFLSLLLEISGSLIIIRAVRLLRIFRIFKLGRYMTEAKILKTALESAKAKITVFIGTVVIAVVVMGTFMYLIEGEKNGFSDIPTGIYWSIVTMTTVGYGDVVPHTILGKIFAGILMILGYGIIAVPTGIVSVELAQASKGNQNNFTCSSCRKEGHDLHAIYCDKCGYKL